MECLTTMEQSSHTINKSQSDALIIERIKEGNKEAFFELVSKYEKKLFKLATVITGNVTDAEDALQESFLAAYNALPKFQGKSTFYTWIYRIVINKSKDLRLKRKKMKQNSIDEHELDFSDNRLNVSLEVEQNELYRFLLEKVNHLKEIYREIIILRFFEQMSYQEISDVLGLREGTVKSRLFKAKDQLKELILADEQGGDFVHDLL